MPRGLRLVRPTPLGAVAANTAKAATAVKAAPVRLFRTTAIRRDAEEEDADDEKDPMAKSVKELEFEKMKEDYFAWLAGPAKNFKKPLLNETNYLGSYDLRTWNRRDDRNSQLTPFPLNPYYKATAVLSDELREDIYRRVMVKGRSVRTVSAELSVSLERITAVVRLKAIEKEMIRKGQPLATYVTKCLQSMMKTTPAPDEISRYPHENIQDVPMHPATHRQAFEPTSESRVFTHEDAAKVFDTASIEEAIPHPDLVILEREKNAGLSRDERIANQRERERIVAEKRAEYEERMRAKREAELKVVEKGRYEWKFKEAKTGQVGFRYGVPHEDRKKGQVKIPTRVDY